MNRSAIIVRNIACNWIGFAVNAGVTLILTPFILRDLGIGRYGVWVLTSSIIGYYGLLDLGFRAGVTQYLTRYLAVGDYGRASEYLSSAAVAFSGLGVLLVGLSIGAAYVVPLAFDIPTDVEYEAFWCILIVGFTSSTHFALFPFTAIFPAKQRYDLANLIGIGTRLLTAGGIVVALTMGYGLIGISAATCGGSLIDYLIRWRVACRLVPELTVSRRQASLARLREIGSFGVWNFLISVNSYVYLHVPNILISVFMPIAAVGHYALATGLSRHINSVLSPVGQVVYPAATELHVLGDISRLERLYHDGSRFMLLATISIVLLAAFLAEDFYRLWIGEKYLSGAPFHSVALVFQIILISTATSYTSNIAAQILMGAGRVRLVGVALICGSILSLTFSLILIRPYGLAGVAASFVIGSVAVDLIAIPLLLQRVLGLSAKDFLRNACVRPVVAGTLQAILLVCIWLTGQAGDWLHLVLQAGLAGAGSVAVVLGVGVTAAERQRFLVQPLRRLRGQESTAAEAASS